MEIAQIILGVLLILAILYLIVFLVDYFKYKKNKQSATEEFSGSPINFALSSAFFNFFDTLGLGSFAPATAYYRQFKLIKDKLIPGTLNTAFTLPLVYQAFAFISEVKVDTLTLVSMLVSAVLGAIIGASIVSKLPENKVRLYMSFALFFVVLIMLSSKFGLTPSGGDAVGLTGWKLILGVTANFILGALMTIGIGLYAPCLAVVYALGMSPLVAFPIMMGSCAFLMIPASIRFIQEGAYNRKATLWSIIGGLVGVFIAVTFVKSLSLSLLTWLVIVAILYTAINMFIDAVKYKKAG